MALCLPAGRRGGGPTGLGRHLLLPTLWRPERRHDGGEPGAASAGRLQVLVPGVHEQPGQTVRPGPGGRFGPGHEVDLSPLSLSASLRRRRTSSASTTAEL